MSQKRNLHPKAETLLSFFPVLLITGVRQCGKTVFSRQLRPDWEYYDLERQRDFDRITEDPAFFFKEHPKHLILDEAQMSPQLFAELRGVVDADRQQNNRFILTGSSSPELIKEVSESLAGRVGILELEPMKMNELYEEELPPFYQIFNEPLNQDHISFLMELPTTRTYNQVQQAFLHGGYPEPALSQNSEFQQLWMENYFQTYIHRDIRRLFPKLNTTNYQRFISMLSSLSGTIVNRSEIGRSLNVSESAIRDYLQIANGSFIWCHLQSFDNDRVRSTVKMPKGHLRDVGILHFLQHVYSTKQLSDFPKVGNHFEGFIIEEIIRGAQASSARNLQASYYRTRNGAEVDLILQGSFGVLPIEIKYGSHVKQRQLRSLKDFIQTQNCPFGIVINHADHVEKLTDTILQIPSTYV